MGLQQITGNEIVNSSVTAADLAPGAALSNGQLSVVSSAVGVIADSAGGRLPYKILGQVQPGANAMTTIYTVPASTNTVVTTITICNQSANNLTVNVAANISSQNSHLSLYNRTQSQGNIIDISGDVVAVQANYFGEIWREVSTTSRAQNALQRLDAEVARFNYSGTPDIQAFYLWNAPNINIRTIFRNAIKLFEQNITGTAGNLNNVTIKIGGFIVSGALALPSNRETAFASIGDSLTDAQEGLFYNSVQAFQTTLLRQV
jgi:hypothetical protein